MSWATEQPKDGDVVLHCGHAYGDSPRFHWWKVESGNARFRRPDGTEGEASWIIACAACFAAARGDVLLVLVRGDGTWHGAAPVIRQRKMHS